MKSHCVCGVCQKPGDLRPYGAGGSLICFKCMKASPEREKTAKQELGKVFGALKDEPIVVIDGKGPPRPLRRRTR